MSCFGGRDEQLFLAELTVERLKLTEDKYREDFSDSPPLVKLKFIDFPVFVIEARERDPKAVPQPYDEKVGLVYAAGKSCLFVRKPRDLVGAMQLQPLRIGIFRDNETYPIAEGTVPLSGCLCDQVAMSGNDQDHRPEPYELTGSFNIADPGKNHAGTIKIYFRLSLFGKFIISHYQIFENSCVFQNDYKGELCVMKLKRNSVGDGENQGEFKMNEATKKTTKVEMENPSMLLKATEKGHLLMKKKEKPKLENTKERLAQIREDCVIKSAQPAGVILKAPKPSPRVTMDSPDFECLTSAEKLNDQNYRSLVYRAYPNEPTCACPVNPSGKGKTKKRTQEQECEPVQQSSCRSGCTNRCCSSVRQRKDANDSGTKRGQFMPIHCAPGTKNDEVYSGAGGRVAARMRGGGSGDLGLLNGDFTWYNSRFTMHSRLEGGGGGGGETYPSIGCGKERKGKENFQANEDFLQWDSVNPAFLAINKCKLRNNDEKNKPMCSCPERDQLESVLRKKGHGMCTKKPCLGTDCLIKAFKDAQEFVDSIGKGPGLAGLGIVESPYFGRPQEPREIKKSESKAISVNKVPEIGSQLCNTQNLDNLRQISPNVASTAFSSSMPKKPGVVQEGLTTFPDQSTFASFKSKKKDEKIEKPKETENNPPPNTNFEETPCGEPKCKSRLKKVYTEDGESDAHDKVALNDRTATQKVNSKHLGKSKSLGGPSKNKSKKEDQFVYSFGNAYPASVYGHKDCNLIRPRVPAHMGWMWNQEDTIGKLKPRAGWRPGAISVQLRDMLNEAKEGFLREPRPRSAPAKGKKGNLKKTMSLTGKKTMEDEVEEEVEFPPTLHIHRKDGVYYVTMYPVRQETSEVPRLDEPVNPLQFKIVKSKGSIASSSTASDMEIEFSPPAAVNRPKKKPNVIHVETQVKQQEILDAFKRDSKKPQKPKKGKK